MRVKVRSKTNFPTLRTPAPTELFYFSIILKRLPRFSSFQIFFEYTLFFISNTFIRNARLKLAKNQANAKQHPEAELLLFENYSHSLSMLSSKNNRA